MLIGPDSSNNQREITNGNEAIGWRLRSSSKGLQFCTPSESQWNGSDPGTNEGTATLTPKNLPFYARWFDPSCIHPLEREELREFFEGKPSKTPELYTQLRNFIVTLYWTNPKNYLTQTACRTAIRGDVNAVMRVHAFLEHQGVINFNYKPSCMNLNSIIKDQFHYLSFAKQDTRVEKTLAPKTVDRASAEDCKKFVESLPEEKQLENGHHKPQNIEPSIFWLNNLRASSLIVDQLFEALKVFRPRCQRCSKPVVKNWYAKKLDLNLGAKAPRGNFFVVCENCFEAENFPVYFSREAFELVTIEAFSLAADPNSSGKFEVSIEDKLAVFDCMQDPCTLEELLRKLRKRLQGKSEIELMLLALKIPNEVKIEQENDLILETSKLNPCLSSERLSSVFEKKLRSIDRLLADVSQEKEPQEFNENSVAAQQRLQQKEQELNLRLETVGKKLTFFAEFEKILLHEKLNLLALK